MHSALRYVLTVGMLGATLAIWTHTGGHPPAVLHVPLDRIPTRIDGWSALPDESLDARILSRLRPTNYLARTYTRGRERMMLFIAYYGRQRAGESVHSPENCLPGRGWSIARKGTAAVRFDGDVVRVNDYTIKRNGERATVFYWYQSPRRILASEYAGKLYQMRDAIAERDTSGSIVRLSLPENSGASAAAAQFAAKLMPEVQRCLTGLN
jgi:EpsI family protein